MHVHRILGDFINDGIIFEPALNLRKTPLI